MDKERFLIAAAPSQLAQLERWQAEPVHLAYRIGPEGQLLRGAEAAAVRGGLMFLPPPPPLGALQVARLRRELLQECAQRNFSGVFAGADLQTPGLDALFGPLCRDLARNGRELYLPEGLGELVPACRVVVSSALSGGSLESRLEQAGQRCGTQRCVLGLESMAEDFPLPAPTGCGRPLTGQELGQLRRQVQTPVFFSPALCAHYFTYIAPDDRAHFVLFDDRDSLCRKLALARELGIPRAFLTFPEVEDILPRLLAE